MVNVSSFLGDIPFAETAPFHYSSYSTTKAAVNMANVKYHVE